MFIWIIIALFIALFILKRFIEKSLREEQKPRGPAAAAPPAENGPRSRSFSSSRVPKVSFAWTWMQCAGKFGYSYLRQGSEQLYPSIEGDEGSCRICIRAVPGKSGKKLDTLMEVEFPVSAHLGLYLVKGEDLADGKGKGPRKDAAEFFGSPQCRNLALFLEDEERFRRNCAAVCENFLLKNWDLYQDFTLTDHSFLLRFQGVEQDLQRFEARIETLVDAGQCFSALSEYAAKSLPAEKTPSSAPAEILLNTETPAVKPIREEESALPMQSSVPEQIPQDPAPAPSAEEAPPPAENPAVQLEVPSAEEAAPLQEADKESLIASLWSSSFPGDAEKKLFETQYKGKTVCWEGVLRSSYPYSFDFVFGRDGGIKSSVDLLEITQGNSSFKVKIKALISFPPEEAERLRSGAGKNIVFQGTLLKCEALSRELYLTEGRILSLGDH